MRGGNLFRFVVELSRAAAARARLGAPRANVRVGTLAESDPFPSGLLLRSVRRRAAPSPSAKQCGRRRGDWVLLVSLARISLAAQILFVFFARLTTRYSATAATAILSLSPSYRFFNLAPRMKS